MASDFRTKLNSIRDGLSTPASAILVGCQSLSAQFGSDGHDDLERGVTAARDLGKCIQESLDADSDPLAAQGADMEALERRIRHDLRNAVGIVRGYLEMVEEDAVDAGDDDLVSAVSPLLTVLGDLEHRIDVLLDFGLVETRDSQDDDATSRAPAISEPPRNANPADETSDITGKILVVDDVAANRDVISERLRRDGHAVQTAASGREALDLMRGQDFDVVLLDLMMPGMSGFDVMEEMRESPVLRDIGIIVISGMNQEEAAIRSITLGAEDYLSKPVKPVLLKARLGACLVRKRWRDQERLYRIHLEAEKDRSEALLLNTLPAPVVKRLASGERVIADAYDAATVLFSDFASFTGFASLRKPREVVEFLNRIFSGFDDLGLDLGVEKIKTIGDGYLAVAGVPVQRPDHAEIAADMALGMIDILESENRRQGTDLKMRIGLHSGPVVAGIIGSHKFAYDIWGHTVNTAARHESYGPLQRVHVSAETAALLAPKFDLENRGAMEMRGLGSVKTYILSGRRIAKRPSGSAGTGTDRLSVLVADDDQSIREFMAHRARRMGWDMDVAADGNEAWNILQNRRFDLLITDCSMPVVDGFELTRRIRHAEKFSGDHMPIIALTGSSSVEIAQDCVDAGMDTFLQKPVMWGELEKSILRLQGKSAETGTDGAAADEPKTAPEILDLSAMTEAYGKIDENAVEALDAFLEAVDRQRSLLSASAGAHDFPRAANAAHALVGLARTAGARELAVIGSELKRALDGRDVVQAGICSERVDAALGRLRGRIRDIEPERGS